MTTMNVYDKDKNTVAVEKPNANGQQTMANSRPVCLASDQSPIPIDGETRPFSPGYTATPGGKSAAVFDEDGNLLSRGPIHTDEGGFRCNFANASIWVAIGTITATAGEVEITGTDFDLVDLRVGDYVSLSGQEGVAGQIKKFTATTITLWDPWTGTTGTGTGVRSIMGQRITADGTITVANGQVTIASGVAIGGETGLFRSVDTLPLIGISRLSLSQRIANQTFYLGFCNNEDPTLATSFAWLAFDGTTVTQVKGVSGRNPTAVPVAAETQSQTLTIATTASAQEFRIELLKDRVILSAAGAINGTNSITVPLASDEMYLLAQWVNGGTAPASNSNAVLDFVACNNSNEVTTYPISRELQPVRHGDGTNFLPAADVAARKLFASLTDGTNTAAVLATILALKTDLSSVAGTATVNAGVAGVQAIGGNAAHSAAAAGNPVQVAGVAATGYDTTVATGDLCRLLLSLSQQLVTIEGSVPDQTWQYAAASGGVINTADVVLKAAGAAGVRNYLKTLTLKNVNAVAGEVVIKDGATIIWRGHVSASMLNSDEITFNPPLRGTAATALNFACITTGQQVYANATGYQGA